MSEKKSRILYIKRYLEEQTDEEHPATVAEIAVWLAEQDITANGRTVAQDISLLIESGADIVKNKSRQVTYFSGARPFELAELKLLVDAAQASRFLSVKRSRSLIVKLLSLAEVSNCSFKEI